MTRVGSQFTFCSPEKILRRNVVELTNDSVINQLFGLDDTTVEPAHTLFFDGVLSIGIKSLKAQPIEFKKLTATLASEFQYIDLSGSLPTQEIKPTHQKLLLDFGTENRSEINSLLTDWNPFFESFNLFDVIAACTYYPTLLLEGNGELCKNKKTNLTLWENTNLLKKQITESTRIRIIK